MRIAILSRDASLWSCRRLREAAIQRGHLVDIVDPLTCYMNINPASPSVHDKGRRLPHYDAVIPRIGSAITFYGTAVLRQFEMLGSWPLNESVAITRARDKLRSLQLLARQAAESVIDAFRGLKAHILVQEYIKEAKGRDIRCLVIGDRVVAAIERQAKEGDFRSNLHRGGMARNVTITPREREVALKAVETLGLEVAGVDILRSQRGPLVMEVNASPGLEGVETTSGIDIAGQMIRWIEQHARPGFCLKTGG